MAIPAEVLRPGEDSRLERCYQALLFRGITDNTEGVWRLVVLDMQDGLPAARSHKALTAAWYQLVWQHNVLKMERRRKNELVNRDNWHEFSLLLTPLSWFEDERFRRDRRAVCPDGFMFTPSALDPEELGRWDRWFT